MYDLSVRPNVSSLSGMGSSRTVLVLEDTSRTKFRRPWPWPWPRMWCPRTHLGIYANVIQTIAKIIREGDKCCTTVTSSTTIRDHNIQSMSTPTPSTSSSSMNEPEPVGPPAKKCKSTLFASYERRRDTATHSTATVSIRSSVLHYLELVEKQTAAAGNSCIAWANIRGDESIRILQPLLERVFSVPASSAPVERVFSQSGLIMRPNRSRLTKKMLSQLVFLKCNSHL